MDVQLRNELRSHALIAVVAFAIFWFGYSLIKGLMFGAAVFLILVLATAAHRWWKTRRP